MGYNFIIPPNVDLQIGTQLIEGSFVDTSVNSLLSNYPPRDVNDYLGRTNGDWNIGYSMFATPQIGQITLCPGGQTALNSNDLTTTINLKEVNISVCLISVNQNKNIVETSLPGRDGTIKTYMGKGDYEIGIEAYLFQSDDINWVGSNFNGIYPKNIVQDLIEICEAPCLINITSDHLLMFNNNPGFSSGISYLSIKEYEISQYEGQSSMQKITMTCSSDNPQSYASIITY